MDWRELIMATRIAKSNGTAVTIELRSILETALDDLLHRGRAQREERGYGTSQGI
jgi:hypothetical protein